MSVSPVQSAERSKFKRVVIPILSVVLIPFITLLFDRYNRLSQDRKEELDLQARLIDELTSSFTTAVIQADFFAAKLVPVVRESPAAASPDAYSDALARWLTNSSKVGSQLTTYYRAVSRCPSSSADIYRGPIRHRAQCGWLPLFAATTDYLRLRTNVETFDRSAAVHRIRDVIDHVEPEHGPVDWQALTNAGGEGFYPVFRHIQNLLLTARDQYLDDIRRSDAKGFVRHLMDFSP